MPLTLVRENNPLADPARQRAVLAAVPVRPFEAALADADRWPLRAATPGPR